MKCSAGLLAALETKQVAELFNQIKPLARRGIVDIDKCLDEGTQVSVWNANHGKEVTAGLLVIFISDLVNAYNVSRPMTQAQIMDLAVDMTNDLWQFRIEEIGAFFQAMKRGAYGKIYERLDPPMIWECWGVYELERAEVVETRRGRQVFKDPTLTQIDRESKEAGRLEYTGVRLGEIKALRDPNKFKADPKSE